MFPPKTLILRGSLDAWFRRTHSLASSSEEVLKRRRATRTIDHGSSGVRKRHSLAMLFIRHCAAILACLLGTADSSFVLNVGARSVVDVSASSLLLEKHHGTTGATCMSNALFHQRRHASVRASIVLKMNSGDNDKVVCTKEDTIRVRLWRALVAANGTELSLRQLGAATGQHKDLKSHLVHVEKQSKTLQTKSVAWLERRGLSDHYLESKKLGKLRVTSRRDRKETFVKLG